MMPSRSTPNLQQTCPRENKLYAYYEPAAVAASAAASRDDDSPPPAPPVRDSSSLKGVKYGPGHEKFPSWPVPSAAEAPQAMRGPPSGGSHRSKSWTDHTNYPKEKVVTYTRPYMKRQHSTHNQQKLKTVMERCEKIPAEVFDSRYDKLNDRLYLPTLDRDGKQLGDVDYMVPSPPERDTCKPQLTQADLEEYARSYQDPSIGHFGQDKGLTEDFIKYARNYEDSFMGQKGHDLMQMHQKQLSYAQSEGYHSYVSSSDSTSTPFLDRLRRDSEAVATTHRSWEDDHDPKGRDSVVTTSSGSASSSETLKWHGSMSDVSVASSSCTHLASNKQLIAHSARVQTPQRHHSESVLYMGGGGGGNGAAVETHDGWKDKESRNNSANKLKLFPVNTYTVPESTSPNNNRINELEKQQKYSYLDPDKKHKIPDPTLKAIQKKALLSFYERHQTNKGQNWRSEPQLAQGFQPTPQPPPRVKVQPSRRASSASDYASNNSSKRSSLASNREAKLSTPKHQHSNSCGSLSTDLLGPVIVGPSISLDDWVPERPPKNPHLRNVFPDLFQDQRVPSPDLPPPSPPTVLEDEVFHSDEPLPPPPSEMETSDWQQEFQERLKESTTSNQAASPQVETRSSGFSNSEGVNEIGLPESSEMSSLHERERSLHERSLPDRKVIEKSDKTRNLHERSLVEKVLPDRTHCDRISPEKSFSERGNIKYSSTRKSASAREQLGLTKHYDQRFPAMKKVVLNGSIAVSQKVANGDQYRAEPLRAQPLIKERQDVALRERVDPLGKCQDKMDGVVVKNLQRASIAEVTPREAPPPLQPRQMRINQSMRARISENRPAGIALRMSPPKDDKLKDSRPLGYTMSQSKASYLASRRERERIVPDSDTGSYKRTISPNGHVITSEPFAEPTRINSRETVWPTKETILKNNNNANLLRRASMNDKPLKIEDKDEFKKVVLPDVLPVNAKLMPRYITRPSQLSLAPEEVVRKSPPKSPPSFRPLKKAQLSHSAPATPSTDSLETRTSPPAIRPSLSPGSPKKASPVRRISPLSAVSTPLKTSPLTSPEVTPPQSPKEAECPKVLEGLQLIQRTEVVLRVNACTTDASSQTEKEEMPPTPLPTRRKLQEEIECEKLSEDFVSQLPPTSDRLKDILVQGPDHKKPTDYVSGLFRLEVTSRPRPANSPFRSRTTTPSSSPPPTSNTTTLSTTKSSDSMTVTTVVVPTPEPASPLSATSTYFTTSEPKARFLTRYSQDMNHLNVVKDTKDLNQKKDELVSRLDRKLEVLREEQLVVVEECRINDELGENVESHVAQLARPHEAAKFRLHVEEVGKITSLLLGLSGRLARAANALMTMPEDHPERRILEGKRDKLQEQLEEAKKLKECIDRRSVNVANILYKYLNSEEYADYDHFINMKAKLIMDSKEISDKIKLGEEQLLALKETLIVP